MNLVIGAECILLFKKNLVVSFGQYDIGMGVPDLADSDACCRDDLRPRVKLGFIMVDHDDHMVGFRKFNGLF